MQFAKDSIYIALRDRLAALNPGRTITLDGVTRPAVVVEENLPLRAAPALPSAFYLQFGGVRKVRLYEKAPRPLLAQEVGITYSASGTGEAGLDQGRELGALDAELLQICSPPSTAKYDYTQTPPAPLGSTVIWDAPQLEQPQFSQGGLSRRARLTLYFFPEVNC
jgi:hypothetical protein